MVFFVGTAGLGICRNSKSFTGSVGVRWDALEWGVGYTYWYGWAVVITTSEVNYFSQKVVKLIRE